MGRRVVITGMGAITPVGNNVGTFWNSVKEGKNGIDFIDKFDTSDFDVKVAAQVKNFNANDYMDKKEARKLDKFSQYAIVASQEAVENSNLDFSKENMERVGVILGCGIGGMSTVEEQSSRLKEKGPKRVSPMVIPMIIANMSSGNVAIKYGAKGICTTIVTACASSNNAIGEAFHKIKDNRADIMFTGGTEACISPLGIAGFMALRALSTSTDVNKASIPFDFNRNGFVMGEGSAILILEEYNHAIARDAKIYAEIVGYGATCDAYHMTAPAIDGEGGARAMKMAIDEGEIQSDDISYINAHGTSTQANDRAETLAIKSVFGEKAYHIPISSTKSMIGHLLGAAGAVEAVACIKALEDGFIPPTIGLESPDPACDLDYVPKVGRKANLNYVLSNSLGFGGHNATLLFKKWTGR